MPTDRLQGHGNTGTKSDIRGERKSLREKQDKIKSPIRGGKSLDEVKTAFGIPVTPAKPHWAVRQMGSTFGSRIRGWTREDLIRVNPRRTVLCVMILIIQNCALPHCT